MVNPQQYTLREERTGKIFFENLSRMQKTTMEQLLKDG